MKKLNKTDEFFHYIPEFYNDNVNSKTGKKYGWIPDCEFHMPYKSKSAAIASLAFRKSRGEKTRLRIEKLKCIEVTFEDV